MILETENLTRRYPGVTALDGLTLGLPEGATGLLGPNGAGKSTLIKLVLALLSPNEGRIRILGLDPARDPLAVRRQVGYMPEHESFVPGLNAVEYVCLAGRLVGMPRNDAMKRTHLVLNYVGLDEERYRPIQGYSTGMKQKAKLAQALVHHPKLLLLDEPTSGLDPRARHDMLQLIRDIGTHGVHVLLSTHILPDVERTCGHVAILNHGRLIRDGKLETILQGNENAWEVRIKGDEAKFREALGENGERREDGSWRVTGTSDARSILAAATKAGVQIRHLGSFRSSLDDLFARTMEGGS